MDASVNDAGEYVFGAFRLDPVRRQLRRDGEPIKLTPRLFDALLLLIRHAGHVIEKDEMMAALWPGRIVEEANLSQTIFALRKALSVSGTEESLIVTAPGRGYRFAAPVRLEIDEAAQPQTIVPQPMDAAPAPARAFRWRGWIAAAAMTGALAGGAVLTRHTMAPPPAAKAAFDPPAHSVAVLAFTNMSGDPAQDYFGDGLAEELIGALGRVPAVHVAARVSTFSFKGSNATIREIAEKLNVGAVLEGSVRRGSDMLRISTQLIDARTGFQIWSRSYDRDPRDLLQVEGDIAAAVTASLQISLVEGEAARLTLGGTNNPAAFDAFLHGMLLLRTNEDAAIARARDAFDTAIRLDPNYAHAYAGRAYALCDIGMNPAPGASAAATADIFKQALDSADKAIALAPDLAAGHAARGEVLDNGFVRIGEAAAEVTRARDLEPGSAAMVGAYAQIEQDLGHFDEAVSAARLATTLDPLRPDAWYVLGYTLLAARRFTESLAVTEHERGLRGGTLPEHSMELLARDQMMLGRFGEAEQSCHSVSDNDRDVCLAIAEHAVGKQADAQARVLRMLAQPADSGPYELAEIYAQWRDTPNALTWLETAVRTHDPALAQLRSDPLLDPIHGEPRYQAVEGELDLPR